MPLIGIVVGCRNNKVTKKYFTLTTVGYGDIYPITIGGKIFTFIILIIGLGIIAVPPVSLHQHFQKPESRIKKAGNMGSP